MGGRQRVALITSARSAERLSAQRDARREMRRGWRDASFWQERFHIAISVLGHDSLFVLVVRHGVWLTRITLKDTSCIQIIQSRVKEVLFLFNS